MAISQLSFNHNLAEGGGEMLSWKPFAFDYFGERLFGSSGHWVKNVSVTFGRTQFVPTLWKKPVTVGTQGTCALR